MATTELAQRLSDERLQAVEDRLFEALARCSEWRVEEAADPDYPDVLAFDQAGEWYVAMGTDRATAQFLASAPTDMLDLLTEVRRLRDNVQRLGAFGGR